MITPTLRAHLGSERGARPLTVETLGHDIASLVETLGLNRVAAIGWSMGAMALWAASGRLERRLRALVVEEMSPKIVNDASWGLGLAGAYAAGSVEGTLGEITTDWGAYVRRLAPRMFSSATRERRAELVSWTGDQMAKADPLAMAAYWRSMAAQDFRASLSTIGAPVLALRGDDSDIYPPSATEFAGRAAPHGAIAAIGGAGHVPHLEAPDSFFEHVSDFLNRAYHHETLREGLNP